MEKFSGPNKTRFQIAARRHGTAQKSRIEHLKFRAERGNTDTVEFRNPGAWTTLRQRPERLAKIRFQRFEIGQRISGN